MPDRFYAPGNWPDRVPTEEVLLELDETEAHHLSRVLRAGPGDQIEIFDGCGHSAPAKVETISKRSVIVRVLPPVHFLPAATPELILAVALPKGERVKWMIEKVTELGVDRLIPLETERSVVKPSDQKLHKLEKTVIAACKQSGRNHVLQTDDVCPLAKLPEKLDLSRTAIWIGSPVGEPLSTAKIKSTYNYEKVLAVIGPEGGLTDPEVDLLQSWSGVPISLSPLTLRIETAAIAFAAWLSAGRMTAEADKS